jgi:Family of unknown function (DUF5947)
MNDGLAALAALRRRARKRQEQERCDLCSAVVPPDHRHLVEVKSRQIACACPACAILFPAQANARYKEVPREIRRLDDFSLTDAQWDGLMIPINIAFFLRNSLDGKMAAFYPSPAGATESLLDLKTWNELAGDIVLRDDVEALVVHRLRGRREYYVLPIDHCYRLVGLIRTKWRGLSGGDDVHAAIDSFFDEMRNA